MASLLPGLRRAAPRISRDFFVCHQCVKQSRPAIRKATFLPTTTTSGTLRAIRFNSTTATLPEIIGRPKRTSPLNDLGQTINNGVPQKAQKVMKADFYPETSSNTVAYWLLGSAVSVFGIVVFGGLTRLTESGYVVPLCTYSIPNSNTSQSKHYRMETRNRFAPSPLPRGLAIRIRQIPCLPRIQAPQSPYDTRGVQENLLHGMGPSTMG